MKKQDILPWDWGRIIIGEIPASFFIEAAIRTFVIYAILTVAMRMMGKRMAGRLSRNELIAMVTLAAAIGIPIQSPDRGLLPAAIIATVVIFMEKALSAWAFRSQRFEKFSQGNIDVLVEDGSMQPAAMKHARITRERVIAQLRSNGIKHLGEVKRLYIEANGAFTLVRYDQPQPGLSVLPDWDVAFVKRQKTADISFCSYCGSPKVDLDTCSNSGNEKWVAGAE